MGDQYGVCNVQAFGAAGDGVKDDTHAIQAAIWAASVRDGVVYIPPGTYRVLPGSANGVIFSVPGTGVQILGTGRSVLKLGPASPAYLAVIQSVTADGFRVEGVVFDHNIAENPIRGNELFEGGPRFSIAASGAGIRIENCEVTNASSVNDFVLSGSDITVRDCRWTNIGDDPTHAAHDSSAIYTQNASGVLIESCSFHGARAGAPGLHTAIEMHGSSHVIRGNLIENFMKGMNVTGIAVTDSVGLVVTHNVIRGAAYGILLHSSPYLTHTTGFGIDGAVIECNQIQILRSDTWSGSGNAVGGIVVFPDATLDVRGLKIRGNHISAPVAAEVIDENTASCGIGWYSQAGCTMHASDISGNTIVGFPTAGIRLSCGINGVRVTDNQLHDCGNTLKAMAVAYKTPIFIYTPSGAGLLIDRNTITDANEVTRNAYGIYLSTAAATMVCVLGNAINILGDASAFVSGTYVAEGAAPLVRGLYVNGVDVAA